MNDLSSLSESDLSERMVTIMNYSSADTIWVLSGTAMVFFMQAGFAMLETGFTRAKNAGNIIMKNLLDFCVSSLVFWIIGYSLMYGDGNAFAGKLSFFAGSDICNTRSIPPLVHILYATVFCGTSTTIVSGAMAERTKFKAYIAYTIVMSAIVFPIAGHWIWGGGWLSKLSIGNASGFIDYAGSSLVHLIGGTAAYIGISFLGPRIGKYGKDGKSRAIPGHSITLGALGIFILWFGWFGFSGCAGLTAEGDAAVTEISNVIFNTNLSAASATIASMIFTWIRYKKPDISMTLNGALGGLVAATAGCAYVSQGSSVIIGIVSGIITVISIDFIDNVLKRDDPVGSVGVHGMNGLWGTLAVGLFSTKNGVFTTGEWDQFKIQLIGCLAIIAWTCLIIIPAFVIIKKIFGIRVSRNDEITGLDITEHGLSASYTDFAILSDQTISQIPAHIEQLDAENDKYTAAKTYADMSATDIFKVTIICRQNKFDALKTCLDDIGITGITVTQVLGYGTQKGATQYYRGSAVESRLLPKVKVEVVVTKVPVQDVIRAARKALYTGNIGDGKIFVTPVIDAVRVRTGVSGFDALQNDVIQDESST